MIARHEAIRYGRRMVSSAPATPQPARTLPPWAYPGLVGVTFALYFGAIALGAPPFVAYASVALPFVAVVRGIERTHPYCAAWAQDDGQSACDVTHLVVGSSLGGSAGRAAADALVLMLFGQLAPSSTDAWSLVPRVALGFVLAELGRFAWHWAQHHHAALWALHRLHHDTAVVHALKSGRAHIASYALQALATALPVLLAGLGTQVLAACVCLQGLIGILAHANVSFDERWVAWLVQSPSVHRLHHRRDADGREKVNLAASLNLFDWLAGTFESPQREDLEGRPRAGAPFPVGIGTHVAGLLPQLLLRCADDARRDRLLGWWEGTDRARARIASRGGERERSDAVTHAKRAAGQNR
jgi:sterol desaturase/sphingolipid hydroxylase (fatty acid hydroxylase superfamily)